MDVIIDNHHLESEVTAKTVHSSNCKSRDDLHIGKVRIHPDQVKRNSLSKLPKSNRNPNYHKYRNVQANKLSDISSTVGERKPSSSKLGTYQFKIRKDDKLKPSRIPRRKSLTKEISEKENSPTSKTRPNTYQLPTAANNVQRVQVLIGPDFVHDKRVPTNSLGSSRPIPALDQLYSPTADMERERLNDWFLELNAPTNSLESNQRYSNMGPGSASDNSTRGVINAELTSNFPHTTERPTMVFESLNFCERFYKTTNDNVSEWLSSDLEYPTRDDESGYRSLSPPEQADVLRSKHSDGTSVVRHSNESYCLTLTSDTNSEISGVTGDKKKSRLTEQPTVIIGKVPTEGVSRSPCKVDISFNPPQLSQQHVQITKSDLSKNYQYPSSTCPRQTDENHNIPVPSYVDCPSEMLQKTTNFEGEGYESPKTLSSIAATDLEIRDELSSQSTLEQMDDCSLSEDPTNAEWCHQHSRGSMAFTKPSNDSEDTAFTESWDYHYSNDSHHHHHCHTCYKRRRYEIAHQGDAKARCKCENDRFKRFPSSRYKLKHLASLRRRLSFRHICRRRWHSVWKKTAERWAVWSKSPTKLKKLRLMHYLQRSIIWEDADVQTNIAAYRETGTDTALKEQKSASIATSFKFNAWIDTVPSGTLSSSKKARLKHVNLGPSMFPFLHNSNRKSLPLQNLRETKPMKRFNSYPENNKNRHAPNRLHFPYYGKPNSRTDSKNPSLSGSIIEEDRVQETGVKKSFLLSDNMCNVNLLTRSIGTEPIQLYNDKVTSTMLHLDSIRLTSPSKDVYTQMITCNTADTGIMFRPSWNSSSANTLTSNSICSYLKSFATNTDSIPRPIQTNNFASAITSSAIMKHAVNTDTQVTPTPSVRKVSTGFSTSLPMVSEKTSTFKTGSFERIPKKDAAAQVLPPGPVLTVTGTKIMSISSAKMLSATVITSRKDLTSTGILTCQTHFKSGDCLTTPSLLRHDYQSSERISSGTETKSLVFRQNKATSVHEIVLTDIGTLANNSIKTTDFNNGSLDAMLSVGESGTVTDSFIDNTSSTSDLQEYMDAATVSSVTKKIGFSNSTQRSSLGHVQSDVKSLKSAATSTSTCMESLTAESGVQSDKETYNKSVCTDSVAVCKPECLEQVTSAIQTHNDVSVQIAIPTQSEAEATDPHQRSPHIGRSRLISVCMLSNSVCEAKTQTEGICNETANAAIPQTQFKSASILTSQEMMCKPMFGSLSLTANKDPLEGGQVVLCACTQISSNTESNDCLTMPILECPTQTELPRDTSVDLATILSNCTHNCMGSNNSNIDEENKQIQSLCQLMAQGKSSRMEPRCPPVTSVVLSSNLNASKWIKKCTSLDKHYQLMIDPERSSPDASSNTSSKCPIDIIKKFHSLQSTKPSYKLPDTHYDIPEPLPTLSKDSLADVLPINNGFERKIVAPVIKSCNKLMVDKVTSDETLTKDVKESTLQTSPDIRDAATDSVTHQPKSQKSASVLTSRCILPTPSNCCPNDNENHSDCLLVYGKPHCIIHKKNIDAAIQMNPSYRDVELDSRTKSITQSIGLRTSCIGGTTSACACLRKPTDSHGEVLSPKVYKALYETTKLVSKEDCLARDAALSTTRSSSIDTELEAAVLQAAGLPGGHYPRELDPSLCCCRTIDTTLYNADDSMKSNEHLLPGTSEVSTQTCPYCCAKLLEIPSSEINPIEECVKTHLVASCRYYSNLLTKQLGRVKDNLKKNMTPSIEACLYQIPDLSYTEACTMKPSGREELGCQTIKAKNKPARPLSCCTLSPAISLTDICKYDKEHLKSVYYILASIEGRLRRLKTNISV